MINDQTLLKLVIDAGVCILDAEMILFMNIFIRLRFHVDECRYLILNAYLLETNLTKIIAYSNTNRIAIGNFSDTTIKILYLRIYFRDALILIIKIIIVLCYIF